MAQSSKRRESEAWWYFTVVPEMEHLAECTLCNTKIARATANAPKSAYSLKGMWGHLSGVHPEEHRRAKAAQVESISKKKKSDEDARTEKEQQYRLGGVQQTLQAVMKKNEK